MIFPPYTQEKPKRQNINANRTQNSSIAAFYIHSKGRDFKTTASNPFLPEFFSHLLLDLVNLSQFHLGERWPSESPQPREFKIQNGYCESNANYYRSKECVPCPRLCVSRGSNADGPMIHWHAPTASQFAELYMQQGAIVTPHGHRRLI